MASPPQSPPAAEPPLLGRLRREYLSRLRVSAQHGSGPPRYASVAHADATDFVARFADEFLAGTKLSKPAFSRLVSSVKTHCRSVAVAVLHDLYDRTDELLAGLEHGGVNVNEACLAQVARLTDPERRTRAVLERTAEPRSFLFTYLDSLTDPETAPATVAFLDWLEDRPLDAVTRFVHRHLGALRADPAGACTFIMDMFDASDEDTVSASWALYDVVHGFAANGAGAATYETEAAVRARLGPEAWAHIFPSKTAEAIAAANKPQTPAAAPAPAPKPDSPRATQPPGFSALGPPPPVYVCSQPLPREVRVTIVCASAREAAALLAFSENLPGLRVEAFM